MKIAMAGGTGSDLVMEIPYSCLIITPNAIRYRELLDLHSLKLNMFIKCLDLPCLLFPMSIFNVYFVLFFSSFVWCGFFLVFLQ